ncbi:MAG: hypothetical protein HYX32_04830 [Actinobacteria bacterium]|nr:hypothetical protein [Actinomycetota bacterium]
MASRGSSSLALGAETVAALLVGSIEAGSAGGPDGVAAAFVFVVGRDVADGFVLVILQGSALA